MQNDLISRSALIEVLKKQAENNAIMGYMTTYDAIINCIDTVEEQPAAYDTDVVVQQLCILRERGYCPKEDSYECVLNKTCRDCYMERVNEIVRGGGEESE